MQSLPYHSMQCITAKLKSMVMASNLIYPVFMQLPRHPTSLFPTKTAAHYSHSIQHRQMNRCLQQHCYFMQLPHASCMNSKHQRHISHWSHSTCCTMLAIAQHATCIFHTMSTSACHTMCHAMFVIQNPHPYGILPRYSPQRHQRIISIVSNIDK